MASEDQKIKLKKYYYAINAVAFTAILFFPAGIYFFPGSFTWVRYPHFYFWAFVGMFFYQTLFFILQEWWSHKFGNIFWSFFLGYGWLLFFALFVFLTGGVKSTFIFVLIIPTIVSAVRLDEKETFQIGTVSTVLLFLLIFDPAYMYTPALVVQHMLHVFLFGLIMFYIYRMVKETLSVRYEKERAEQRSLELLELDRIKEMFLTTAQHQLRTPLSGARWALQNIIQDSELVEEDRALVEKSKEKVIESINIVNEMLSTAEASVEGFGSNFKKTEINLTQLISTILEDTKYLSRKNDTTIVFDADIQHRVVGDYVMLERALTNVIDNATRYSPGGRVEVSVESVEFGVEIVVTDNGVGIDPEDESKVFEKFYRGKRALSLDSNQSGVGLYLTKSIIELHAGSIDLWSEAGKGTTVKIVLP